MKLAVLALSALTLAGLVGLTARGPQPAATSLAPARLGPGPAGKGAEAPALASIDGPEVEAERAVEEARSLAAPHRAAELAGDGDFAEAPSATLALGRDARLVARLEDPRSRLELVAGPNAGRAAGPDADGLLVLEELYPGRSDVRVVGGLLAGEYALFLRAGVTTEWSPEGATPRPEPVLGDRALTLVVHAPSAAPATVQVLGARHRPDGRAFEVPPGRPFELAGLHPGRVELLVSHPRARAERRTVHLGPEDLAPLAIELRPVPELRGRLTRGGAPLAGVTLRLETERPVAAAQASFALDRREAARVALPLTPAARQETTSDAAGRFAFGDFAPGSARWLTVLDGEGRPLASRRVGSGAELELEL